MNPVCSVRRAGCNDLAALLAIERECAETSHWSEEIWRQALNPAAQLGCARAVFVAHRADEVLGFAVVQCVAGESELEGVAVKLKARRGGLASGLCHAAMAWAQEHAATEMHLEVRASNAAALGMYRVLGFVERGRRRGYYRDPVEDAVWMARPLQARNL